MKLWTMNYELWTMKLWNYETMKFETMKLWNYVVLWAIISPSSTPNLNFYRVLNHDTLYLTKNKKPNNRILNDDTLNLTKIKKSNNRNLNYETLNLISNNEQWTLNLTKNTKLNNRILNYDTLNLTKYIWFTLRR